MPSPPSLTVIRKLSAKKHREREGLYLLEGSSAVGDAITGGHVPAAVLHAPRALDRSGDRSVIAEAKDNDIPMLELDQAELDRISGLKTTPPVLAVMPIPDNPAPSDPVAMPLTLAFDRLSDPGNLGTLIRAAAFYGIPEIWLGHGTVDLFNPKTVRACMGAHLAVRICREVDLDDALDRATANGARTLAAVMDGSPVITPVQPDGPPAVLLLGNEPHGIAFDRVRRTTEQVAIERRGPVDSLNVAMAGVVLIDRLLTR